MLFKIDKICLRYKEIIFICAYSCFFVALFLGDVCQDKTNFSDIEKILRYISYALSIIQFFVRREQPKKLIMELLILLVTIFYFAFTNDVYLLMLVILIIGSKDSSEKNICVVSLCLLIIGTIITVVANIIGLIPDVMTAKAFSTELTRHSYGFYHSNVLPNNVLMIEILLVWFFRGYLKKRIMFIFMSLHVLLYILSGSRMCLVIGVIFSLMLIIIDTRSVSKKDLLYKLTASIGLICGILSFVFTITVNLSTFVQKIDLAFSNRFWSAFLKMKNVGLHVVTLSTNGQFYKDELVLDNGYLFLMMRYGFIVLCGLITVNYIIAKKYHKNARKLLCIASVFGIGFIDNLFLSYRFLPFLMFTFLNVRLTTNKS